MLNKECYLVKDTFQLDLYTEWYVTTPGEIITHIDNDTYTISGIHENRSYNITINLHRTDLSLHIQNKNIIKIKQSNIKTAKLLFQNK